MASKDQTISLTMLAVTSSIGAYTSLLPPFSEVRKAVADSPDHQGTVNDVHMGVIAAGGIAIAVGLTASSLSGTPVPAMASVIAAVVIAAMYESLLRTVPVEQKTATNKESK